jgi:Uma2 family endonuclease
MNVVSTAIGRATLADLALIDGKAELIGGRIIPIMPTGFRPGQVGGRIYRSLDDYAEQRGQGVALPDNVGYAVPELPSGRESFSPDTSYYVGPTPTDEMDFIEGPPTFAVEVRSKNDYGDAAETEMASKRADYFQAGTSVVWDVDPRDERIWAYHATAPHQPRNFVRGQIADAEPIVPGWRIAVDDIFA